MNAPRSLPDQSDSRGAETLRSPKPPAYNLGDAREDVAATIRCGLDHAGRGFVSRPAGTDRDGGTGKTRDYGGGTPYLASDSERADPG